MAKESYLSSMDQLGLGIALRSDDYGWEERQEPQKKVILTNPEELHGVELAQLVSLFRGTGHSEWEFIMSAWMIDAIGKSIDTGEPCDITIIFNTSFLASPRKKGEDYRRFTKEQVYNHIIKFFNIEEETDTTLRLSSKVVKAKK